MRDAAWIMEILADAIDWLFDRLLLRRKEPRKRFEAEAEECEDSSHELPRFLKKTPDENGKVK